MIKNLWEKIELLCMNHEEPCDMRIIQNTELIKTPFYACINYSSDDRDKEAPLCSNRINMDDYQGIVMKFIDKIYDEGPFNDYTNYSFSYKGTRHKIKVKVLKYSPDKEIILGLLNTTVLGGH